MPFMPWWLNYVVSREVVVYPMVVRRQPAEKVCIVPSNESLGAFSVRIICRATKDADVPFSVPAYHDGWGDEGGENVDGKVK